MASAFLESFQQNSSIKNRIELLKAIKILSGIPTHIAVLSQVGDPSGILALAHCGDNLEPYSLYPRLCLYSLQPLEEGFGSNLLEVLFSLHLFV